MGTYSSEIIDRATYGFITEKSLQYMSQPSSTSEDALKRTLELLKAAISFCRVDPNVENENVMGMEAFIFFSQAIRPTGTLVEFADFLTSYCNKIESLLKGDESYKKNIMDFLVSLHNAIEQRSMSTLDKKTRWRL